MIIVGLIFVLTVTLLSWFAFRPNYVVVFNNLPAASLGEISAKLEELGIPNTVGSDTISVPEQYQHEARMKIAMEGLTDKGAPGYGVFDNAALGMTENEFNVRYKQAIEGNIQNAIRTLQGVQDARVSIVLPEKKLFVTEDAQNAKASVVLLLNPGVKLNDDQINGVQQLVSNSVQGLLPANVSIVDQNGVRLVDDNGEPLVAGSNGKVSKQQQIQMEVEAAATKKLRNSLERLVGLGNVDIVVNADIDFDQKTWTEKTLAPVVDNNGAIISEQNNNETSEGTTTGGTAGVDPNDPNQAPQNVAAENGNQSASKKSSIINREWNTRVENGETATYNVNAYTVSVLLNDPNLTDARKQEIIDFVSTAIGREKDGTANDVITVTAGTFQAPENPFQPTAFYEQPWFFGALAAALVLLGGGVYALSRRRKIAADIPVIETAQLDVPVVMEESDSQKMRKQLEKLAHQKPEDFVNLLRTWLVEE